jgi:hypothetical protein
MKFSNREDQEPSKKEGFLRFDLECPYARKDFEFASKFVNIQGFFYDMENDLFRTNIKYGVTPELRRAVNAQTTESNEYRMEKLPELTDDQILTVLEAFRVEYFRLLEENEVPRSE